MGRLRLTKGNVLQMKIFDSTIVTTLFDSGATHSLIHPNVLPPHCQNEIQQLQQPITFTISNGDKIPCNTYIMIPVHINKDHLIIVKAHICDIFGFQMIIGTETMKENDAVLTFKDNTIKFNSTNIRMKTNKHVHLKPGESKTIPLFAKLPSQLQNTEMHIVLTKYMSRFAPPELLIKFNKGKAIIKVMNPTPRKVVISKNLTLAFSKLSTHGTILNKLKPLASQNEDFQNHIYGITSHNKQQRDKLQKDLLAKYPFLKSSDPKSRLFDEEILEKEFDLSSPLLSTKSRQKLKRVLFNNKSAFSLRGEIGKVKDFKIEFEVKPELKPFYIRPFVVTEKQKQIIDENLDHLIKLGVLRKGSSEYSSPLYLIHKRAPDGKIIPDKARLVTDYRHLNQYIVQQNQPFALIHETIQKIGMANPKCISVLDIRQAYFNIPLDEKCQKYTAISNYYSGETFIYNVLPQGMNISPAKFVQVIHTILDQIENRKTFCIPYIDDLIIFSPDQDTHIKHIDLVLQKLSEYGFKLSPSKCEFLKTEIKYMGYLLKVEKDDITIHATEARCEAILKLPRPSTRRQVRRLIGMTGYISQFLPKIRVLCKPLYNLTKKTVPFEWTEDCESAWHSIRKLLISPAVLSLPRSEGKFSLYVDSSLVGTGGYLTQDIDGKERIIGYFSKSFNPKTTVKYSITELEFTGLWHCISHFRFLLLQTHFNCFIDHSAVPHIMKSKKEPATVRLAKLLDKLSLYNFTVCYKKGNSDEIKVADCLSRTDDVTDDPSVFVVTTRSKKDETGEQLLPGLPPRTRTVKVQPAAPNDPLPIQTQFTPPRPPTPYPEVPVGPVVDQPRLPTLPPPPIWQPTPSRIPHPSDQLVINHQQNRSQQLNQELSKLDRQYQPVIDLMPEEDQPSTTTNTPNFLLESAKPLFQNLPTSRDVVAKQLVKPDQIKEILKRLNKTILHDFHIPSSRKEFISSQMADPAFSKVYEYLDTGKLPPNKKDAKRIIRLSESYILIQKVLFRIVETNDTYKTTLCVPQELLPYLLNIHHDLGVHTGIQRLYMTLKQKYYYPGLYQQIYDWLTSCITCQLSHPIPDHNEPPLERLYHRYAPMRLLSIDLSIMPTTPENFKYCMVVQCELTKYTVAVPLKQKSAISIAQALVDHVFFIYSYPWMLASDLGLEFRNQVMEKISEMIGFRLVNCQVLNHKSLTVERQIGHMKAAITKQLLHHGSNWVEHLRAFCYCVNTTIHSHHGMIPYVLVFGQEPTDPVDVLLQIPDIVPKSHKQYLEHIQQKLKTTGEYILNKHNQNQLQKKEEYVNTHRRPTRFKHGSIVFLYVPYLDHLALDSRKLKSRWLGPLILVKLLDTKHAILCTFAGQLLDNIYSTARLKLCHLRANQGPVSNVFDLIKYFREQPKNIPQITDHKGTQLTINYPEIQKVLDKHQLSLDPKQQNSHTEANNVFAITAIVEKTIKNQQEMDSQQAHFSKIRNKKGDVQILIAFKNNPSQSYWDSLLTIIPNREQLQSVLKANIKITGISPEKLLQLYTEKDYRHYNKAFIAFHKQTLLLQQRKTPQ